MAKELILTREHLRRLDIFSRWSNERLDYAMAAVDLAGTFAKDEVCLKEGLPSEHLLLLLYGELGVRSNGIYLGNVLPGEFSVEGALDMSGTTPRNAEVYTVKDSGILLFKPNDFRNTIAFAGAEATHRVYSHITITQNRRLAELNKRFIEAQGSNNNNYELAK